MKDQLGQVRPSSGDVAESLYSPSDARGYEVLCITICNTEEAGGDTAYATLYHDRDGSTYDKNTQIMAVTPVSPGETIHYEGCVCGYLAAANIGCKSSLGNKLTFTAYGIEEGKRV